MVASWVSQASFAPPGITVAVAKDRAIESLLQVNDRFVLNILQENNYLHLFRHFLKRFPPGANRFEGVELMNDLAAGGPVLSDALAFLSCKVIQRMETTDHWIIYSSVEKGNLSNTQSKTAVHHRRVGSNY
jgi:flavin reductase (DIM6/NTAB) family NADH-FMN oxidoreductase RutF